MNDHDTNYFAPPQHLRLGARQLPFWDTVIASRDPGCWNEFEFALCAQLATVQAEIEQLAATVDAQGPLVKTPSGRVKRSPACEALDTCTRLEMALLRALTLGGRVAGDSRHWRSARRAEENARRALAVIGRDSLLAGR